MEEDALAQRVAKLRDPLYALMDEDPEEAIRRARLIQVDDELGPLLTSIVQAGVLVEAGHLARNSPAIEEGVSTLRQLISTGSSRPDISYPLARGLGALAECCERTGSQWHLVTMRLRGEARQKYREAASFDQHPDFAARAFTNLGAQLWCAHRWVEAYDAYQQALSLDPDNAVAALNSGKALMHSVKRGIGDRSVLLAVARGHLERAQRLKDRLRELAGPRAVKDLEDTLAEIPPVRRQASPVCPSELQGYESFVARNRLALSPTVEGLDIKLPRWDSLKIPSVTEPIGTDDRMPALFAMFNVLKADFLVSRFLSYWPTAEAIPDTAVYHDTLDYALYGAKTAALGTAQRTCIDMLDKLAVAASDYFGIPGAPHQIYFKSRWFGQTVRDSLPQWEPTVASAIQGGNHALVALSEVSWDIVNGFLKVKQSWRNACTHRFAVLHDVAMGDSRQSKYIDHCALGEFEAGLVESLQLARSALLYFVEAVTIEEAKRTARWRTGRLHVPDHHRIRGEDGE